QFGRVRYRVVGYPPAPTYFQINEDTGSISTTSVPISSDSNTQYQLFVEAYDNGIPSLTDMDVVTITVNRNLQSPAFNPTTYSQTIDETQVLGETIVRVNATDPDGV
ncbi:hypothetical protein ACJMK2_035671, partial [Sinanodonta woodiana]